MKATLIPINTYLKSDVANLFPSLRPTVRWYARAGTSNKVLIDQNNVSYYKPGRGWRTAVQARHEVAIKSYGFIRKDGKLMVYIGGYTKVIPPPVGTFWDKDSYGLKLVLINSRKDDYHPTFNEFRRFNDELILNQLEINRQNRIKTETEKLAFESECQGVYVCVYDSLRAGNCLQGTLNYAEKHGLDKNKHYLGKDLLNIANGDFGRVKLAISAAIIRHKRELEQGYGLLEEHYYLER